MFLLLPRIDRSGAYSFWPVRLFVCFSTKTFTLAITFIFHIYISWGRTFFKYQSQGHLSRSNIKVTVFEKMAVEGAFVFHKHILFLFLYPSPQQSRGEYTGIAMAVRPSVSGHNFVRSFFPTVLHILL